MANGITDPTQGVTGNIVGDLKSAVNQLGASLQSGASILKSSGEPAHEDEAREIDSKGQSQNPGPIVKSTESIFNPLTVFRYHKFGPFADGEYKANLHYDKNLYGSTGGFDKTFRQDESGISSNSHQYYTRSAKGGNSGDFELFEPGDQGKTIENPSARTIIDWASKQDESKAWSYGPAPYSVTDFAYCKYYGKVPNNRMVTLRRYPMPIDDNIRLPEGEGPAIPLAQAVTWFGEEISNPLKSILDISWDLSWESLTADVWTIDGNELIVDDILDVLGVKDTSGNADFIKALVASNRGDQGTIELAGYDAELNKYIKEAYNDTGPYWNQVLGPVNVVDKTMMRQRGMGDTMFKADITIKFEYSLRSYSGINPKIAFLDLLSNFLTLTYNTAPFWGGGYRYFEKPGIAINQEGVSDIRSGRVVEGLKKILNNMIAGTNGSVDELMNQISGMLLGSGAGGKDTDGAFTIDKGADGGIVLTKNESIKSSEQSGSTPKLADNFAAMFAKGLFKTPLRYQSLLEGRPIGEWHVTVGNPMNPIAVIGNLYLKTVVMELSETLGIDDFPNEVSFTVTLGHGRPRAAQDIESMFNLGNGPMSFTQISPSSASNTFGEGPTGLSNHTSNANRDKNIPPPGNAVPDQGGKVDPSGGGTVINNENAGIGKITTQGQGADIATTLKTRVGKHYGSAYGDNSKLISTYLSTGALGS